MRIDSFMASTPPGAGPRPFAPRGPPGRARGVAPRVRDPSAPQRRVANDQRRLALGSPVSRSTRRPVRAGSLGPALRGGSRPARIARRAEAAGACARDAAPRGVARARRAPRRLCFGQDRPRTQRRAAAGYPGPRRPVEASGSGVERRKGARPATTCATTGGRWSPALGAGAHPGCGCSSPHRREEGAAACHNRTSARPWPLSGARGSAAAAPAAARQERQLLSRRAPRRSSPTRPTAARPAPGPRRPCAASPRCNARGIARSRPRRPGARRHTPAWPRPAAPS